MISVHCYIVKDRFVRVCRDGSALLDRRGRVDANADHICSRMQSYTVANAGSHAGTDLHVRASSMRVGSYEQEWTYSLI
jgi:hypothetical protein